MPLALRNLCLFFLPGWGLLGDGPAPVQELDSKGPGKLPASFKGPCLGGPSAPAPPLGPPAVGGEGKGRYHPDSPAHLAGAEQVPASQRLKLFSGP